MAERRMMSKQFVNNASFMKMSDSAKLLYFYLNVNADDDGIVEAYAYSQMLNTPEDDVKVLCQKEFIVFLNDDWLAFLPHWLINQQLRADRYKPSIHRNTLLNKYPDSISKLKKISLEQFNKSIQQEELKPEVYKKIFGIPTDNQLETQVRSGQKSQGQESLEKGSVDELRSGQIKRSELQKTMTASFLDPKSKEIIMDRVDNFSEEEQIQIFKILSQSKSSIERKTGVMIRGSEYESLTHQMLERVLEELVKKVKSREKVNMFAYLNKSFTEYWNSLVKTIHNERNLNFFQN